MSTREAWFQWREVPDEGVDDIIGAQHELAGIANRIPIARQVGPQP